MRKNHAKGAFRELKAGLKVIAGRSDLSLVQRFNETMAAIGDFLAELRNEVVSAAFADTLEEVFFFKFERPEYVALKYYETALFSLLRDKPVGTSEIIRVFLLEELRFIHRFFKQHGFLYGYFKSGFTELDELLFVRGAEVSFALLPDGDDHDPECATAASDLFARFMAYEALQDFIVGELQELDRLAVAAAPVGMGVGKKKWFDWSGEVINLVELGYAIYLSKQLNEGKAGLQEIFNWLEESFGVEIGIPANRFRELKRRKRLSRTHYTELMQRLLIEYMDADDAL